MRGAARVGHRHGARGRVVRLPSHPDLTGAELGGFAFFLSVDTVRALAAVLEVTNPAVTKAESVGRIARDAAGRFDVFGVVDAWCKNTRHPCGAAEATAAPWWIEWGYAWLARPAYGDDPTDREWDWWDEQRRRDAVVGFIRRTRGAGGRVYARRLGEGDEDGHEVPDPMALLGGAEEIEGAALAELCQLVRDAGERLDFARLVVPELASRVGVAPEVLGPHLARVVRDWIAEDGACQDDTQRWGPPAYPYPTDSDAAFQARIAVPAYVPAPRPAQRWAGAPSAPGAPDAAQGEAHV